MTEQKQSISVSKKNIYNRNTITFKTDRIIRREYIGNILYIICSGRKSIIYTKNYQMNVCAPLKFMYENLNKYGFDYLNQSTLVNFSHIKKFEKNVVTMDNNTMFEVSRPRRKAVINMLLNNEK